VLALYAALALAATWPLARELASQLPRGTDVSATVPLASAWSLWWVADRSAAGFARFWDAPIFFPTRATFAFSEPLLLEGALAAPLLWAGASPVLAHNLVLLAALVANGGFAFALLRALGLGAFAAGAGGAFVCMLPYVHHELGVLALVPLAGVLAVLHALLAFSRGASLARGVRLGVAFAATYALCGQYALFVALAVAPAALLLANRALLEPRSLLALVLALATAAVLVAPVVRAQVAVRREHGFARSERTSVLGAAAQGSFRLAPATPWLPLPGIQAAPEPNQQAHFPGGVKLALALAGLAWGLRRNQTRRFCACLVAIGSGGILLAVLPRLELFGVTPFHGLRELVPGLAQVRSFWRATVLMQLAVALLAALGIQALVAAARSRAWRLAGVAALAAFATAELWPAPPLLSAAPSRAAWQPWLAWIAAHVPEDAPLAHLPVNPTEGVADYAETARAMLLATAHRHPLVNGYSSYFPAPVRAFTRLLRGCPEASAWALLRQIDLRVLMVRSSWLAEAPECGPTQTLYQRAAVFPELDAEIWQAINPDPRAPADTPGAR
jgi:hypothetical protein